MGEVRDRGSISLTTEGQTLLEEALSGMRDEDGKKLTSSSKILGFTPQYRRNSSGPSTASCL